MANFVTLQQWDLINYCILYLHAWEISQLQKDRLSRNQDQLKYFVQLAYEWAR